MLERNEEDWERIESPLRGLDAPLEGYAASNAMDLSKNFKNWPERSLRWCTDEVERHIQVVLGDEENLLFHVWLVASQSREDGLYLKRASVANGLPVDVLQAKLESLLDQSRDLLNEWGAGDLKRRGV